MVSFQPPTTSVNGSCSSSKKRKWEDQETQVQQNEGLFNLEKKRSIDHATKSKPMSIFDIELHFETPLPLEWQRCLDIQSGQIHFYNTRTHKRTSRDPRSTTSTDPEPSSPVHDHMSLELELNLPCDQSQRKTQATKADSGSSIMGFEDFFKLDSSTNKRDAIKYDNKQEEMVATVCTKCNMLVMLFKSTPTCPNCKFLHPQDQSPPKLLQQARLSLLC